MFDLRKDLRIYKSSKADKLRKLVESCRREGSVLYLPAVASILRSKRYDGQIDESIKLSLPEETIQALGDPSDMWLLQHNPTVNYEQLRNGVRVQVPFDAPRAEQALAAVDPMKVARDLLLGPDSRMRNLIGAKLHGWRKKSLQGTKPETVARVWILYGLELQGSAKVDALHEKCRGLPVSDFGLTDVDDMERLVSLVAGVGERKKTILERCREIDALIVKNGGTVPKREKIPRSLALAWVWRELNGVPHPAKEETTDENG